jgi:hypothetical protein
MNPRIWSALLVLVSCLTLLAAQTDYASNVASLIKPSKLATLGERGANSRVQKAVYWLAIARKEGKEPAKVLDRAVTLAGYKHEAGKLTKDALLRNLDIADKLGCLNSAGLAEMKRGRAATVMKGPYKGDELSVDHIIPRGVDADADEREEECQNRRPPA